MKTRPSLPDTPGSGAPAAVPFRWGLYAASLFIPFAGIVIALFLFDSDSREARLVGRSCLLTCFLAWILFPTVVLAGLVLLASVAVLGILSDLMPLDY